MSNETIHPSNLTTLHLGALVRWEHGETIRQGRLGYIEHGYDLLDDDGYTAVMRSSPLQSTRFTIGNETFLATAAGNTTLTIIQDA